MMRSKTEANFGAYANRLRDYGYSDMIPVMHLIEEVKKRQRDENLNDDPQELYLKLLSIADKQGIKNPFLNKDDFYRIYEDSPDDINWEAVLASVLKDNRHGILPEVLIKKLATRFEKSPEKILIAEAEKFTPFLMKLVDENINSEFTLTSMNAEYAGVLKTIFEEYENVKVILTSIYEYEFINERFDLIFSSPIFGGRTLTEGQNFFCREYDMVALENLSYHLTNGGEMTIILPARITFSAGRIADLRTFIQQTYTIKELSALPEGIFAYTGIQTYLLDIENVRPSDDDITIRKYSAGERKSRRSTVTELEIEEDTFVMLSELEQQGDWNIDKIFNQQDKDYLNYQKSGVRKDLIGNVAQVFRGKAVNKKDDKGAIGLVTISSIGDYEIDYENLEHFNEEERKIATYVLNEGDVLLPARGTAIRTAVFHKQNALCIAHANVIVIRPDEKQLDGTYLKIFLDSPLGNKMISGAQQGMTVMNISYKDLNAIEIPIPPLEEQKKRAQEYKEELEKYKKSVAEAEKRWKGVLRKMQSF